VTYRIIYADPPWTFRTWSNKGKNRSAEKHYSCLKQEDLKALPVEQLSEPDCTLFLWATDPLLPQAFDLINAWGFTYKTIGFVWVKLNKRAPALKFGISDFFTGMGYWTRANSELCLLATRGQPQRQSQSVRRLVIDHRREHSRKPDAVPERIVKLMGDVPRIELFARTTRRGWNNWGLEKDKFSC
jgi:N6-adenosine-specific RNA methylase IME4